VSDIRFQYGKPILATESQRPLKILVRRCPIFELGANLLCDTIRLIVARVFRLLFSLPPLQLSLTKRMGSSVSRLPENLTEQECKKLAGIRWDAGLSAVFADAPKNEDGTISKAMYLEHFLIDPFQVHPSLFLISPDTHPPLGSHHGSSFGTKSISQR
jgi:hypothetical protein